MHILIIASFYPSAIRPHTGIFFQDQARALQRAGHQVAVLALPRLRETLHDWRAHLPRLPEITREDAEGLVVYRMQRLWFPRVFPGICRWLTWHYGQRAFDRYIAEQGKPDVLHAHNTFYAGYLAAALKGTYCIPTVLTEHSTNFLRGRIFLRGQHSVARYTLEHIDKVTAVGPTLAQALEEYTTGKQITISNNIVDTDYFTLTEAAPQNPFTFAAVGTLEPRKGFDILIRAFAQAFTGKKAKLIIGGGGQQYKKLQALVNDLNLTTQVLLPGRLSRAGVRELFQKSHVVVSSSYVETFGVTLIEALSCGKPIIATRSGGPERFVTPQNGLLAPPGDIDQLAQAMAQIFRTYSQFNPKQIRQYCINHFGERAVVQQLEALYASASSD